MAGRFTNLEFDHHREEPLARNATNRQIVDNIADRYLTQAIEARRWGRFEEALRLYTRLLGEDRTCVTAWVGQIQMLVELDECHEARVWSDKALELFRDNGELLAAKAQACARLRDHKTALACSDGALRTAGESPWRWQARGEVLLAKGERFYDECFHKAVALPTADWFDRVIVARILQYYGRLTGALHYLKQTVEREPGHGYPWLVMGECQWALALKNPARASFERCLELRPDWTDAHQALDELDRSGSLLGQLGRLLVRRRRP